MKTETQLKNKQIHITLSAQAHQRLRVKCALEDISIQQYVEKLVEGATRDVIIPETVKPSKDKK